MKLFSLLLFATLAFACENNSSSKISEKKPASEKTEIKKEEAKKEKPEMVQIEVATKIVDPAGLKRGSDEQIQLLVEAKSAMLNQDWDRADASFDKIIKSQPLSGEKVTAYIARANSYRDTKQPKKAIALLKELDKLGTQLAEVQFVLARSYSDLGESTAAIKAYEWTVKIQPEYLQAIVELAGAYIMAGRKEEGEKMYYEYEKKIHNYSKILTSDVTTEAEQLQVLDVFNMLDDEGANKAIVKALNSKFPAVREESIGLVRDFKLADSKEVLAKLEKMGLEDTDLRVRMMAKDAAKAVASPSMKK